MSLERIQNLARRCAASGLSLAESRYLLDAMLITDALAIEHGNTSAAAERLGIDRVTLARIVRRKTARAYV